MTAGLAYRSRPPFSTSSRPNPLISGCTSRPASWPARGPRHVGHRRLLTDEKQMVAWAERLPQAAPRTPECGGCHWKR